MSSSENKSNRKHMSTFYEEWPNNLMNVNGYKGIRIKEYVADIISCNQVLAVDLLLT
jgi:hypothetical protein